MTVPSVTIYTDGACSGNPGPGGWGACLKSGARERLLSGYHPETTNNQMELTAIIRALEALTVPCRLEIYSDSQYAIKGMTEWLKAWKARGWQTAAKKPVKNVDLWQRLDELAAGHEIAWLWVKGHAGHEGNETVDKLATRAIEEKQGIDERR